MANPCQGELSSLAPTINGCPADTELLLFCNVAGQTGGYAFRTWATVKGCLITQLFGGGSLTFTGDMLNGSNIYTNASLPPLILLYYNGLGRFLIYGTEWKYVNNTNTSAGIQVLIPSSFTSADYFTAVANP